MSVINGMMSLVTTRDRLATLVIVTIVASNFGPYLAGGLRTDQIFIYGAAGAVVILAPWKWLSWRPSRLQINLAAVWVGYALVGVVGSLGAPIGRFLPGSLLAGLDNLLLPLAVMITVWLVVTPARRERALLGACRALVWLAAANGLLAAIATRADLSTILRPFWAGDIQTGDGLAVAERAAQLGRFSGVFNQPAEAGLMYGLAGLSAVYVYRDRPRRMYLLLVPIFVGGVLCVSKVFLIAAAPLIMWQVWRTARSRIVLVLALGLTSLGLVQSQLFQAWSGGVFLQRLIRPGQNGYVDYYTAGRLGRGSSLTGVVSEVLEGSPVSGFGLRGLQVAYDNGWVEALVVAGALGAAAYTVVLMLLLLLPRMLSGAERRLAWGIVLTALMASVGVPALTANRSGALLWTIVALLAVAKPARDSPNADACQRRAKADSVSTLGSTTRRALHPGVDGPLQG